MCVGYRNIVKGGAILGGERKSIEYRGGELLFVVETLGTGATKLLRPFNQTGGSKDIGAEIIDRATKDSTGIDYGKITESISLEGILTEGDEAIDSIVRAIRTRKLVRIYEVNTRDNTAESGMYLLSSFNREYTNGEFATYSLEATLSGSVSKSSLSMTPDGDGYNPTLDELVTKYYAIEDRISSIETSKRTADILDYHADNAGVLGASDALNKAISNKNTDVIFFPKGVYLIDKAVTVPAEKRLQFSRNARLKIAADITIDGSWEAGEDDWIFELVGGYVKGDPKLSIIRPEWFGARGDNITDDSKSFNDAMSICAKKRVMHLGAKSYRIRSTIENNARGIRGVANYRDSQNGGTVLSWDPIDNETDLLPCLRIGNGAYAGEFSDFTVIGRTPYNTRDLSKWIDKDQFAQDKYEMFALGYSGIEVTNTTTPAFRNIHTAGVKVGILLNSRNGHITFYDCSLHGLIGVYCRKNSGDYFFQGGGIAGSFCGIMFGIVLEANHYGGMDVNMNRVHMGFSPYSIYQVKDADNYDELAVVGGLSANLRTVRFERVGEAAIKLLPKSVSGGITISGFGLSWSPIDNPNQESGGWISCLPHDILPRDQKQKYAVYLGKIGGNVEILDRDFGGVTKSNAPGALGTAYIDILSGNANLTGLDIENVVIRRKLPPVTIDMSTPQSVGNMLRTKRLNPLSAGNLMKNPEDLSSWRLLGTGEGALSLVPSTDIPIPFSRNVKNHIGSGVNILKYTPDGTNAQVICLYPPTNPMKLEDGGKICYELFVLSSKAAIITRLSLVGGKYLYNETAKGNSNEWMQVSARGQSTEGASLSHLEILSVSPTEPTYVAGVMVSYDELAPYSPYPHVYTPEPIETADGLILTDTATGTRYKVTISNGALNISPTQ